MRLSELVDMSVVQKLAVASYNANGMPTGIIDAFDGSILVGCGWQEICVRFHRAHPRSAERCRESDDFIKENLSGELPCEYRCKNGLRDIGVPIIASGDHLATLFLGQFFYEGESPDRDFFIRQARELEYDEETYLAALDRVPVFSRRSVENIVEYNRVLARFIGDLADRARQNAAAEKALREADRRKSEFLAVLSHELRNPLAPIRNSLYILDHVAPGSDQAARAKAVIDRQVGHLTRLVDDLLDVTRISHGKIELERALVDLKDLVRRTCEDHHSAFTERGIALRIDVPADPIWIDADATRIAQIVGNLLHNAAKFTNRGGKTNVTVATAGDRAEIRVRDDGIGIDPDHLQRMFEPFEQAERGLARTRGGLGLGLALVKALAELHGGSVRASSEGANRGSEFVVALPLAAPDRRRWFTCDPREEGSRIVLIIEDNPDAGQTLAEVLALSGHRAHLARDGHSGIAKARDLRPDVVLCDIGLPDIDGYEVARTVRADETLRSTVLVALSGYAQPEDRQRAFDAGFDAHLPKPPPFDELEKWLAKAP